MDAPKKRGRKPKIQNNTEEIVKKKRGRKRKSEVDFATFPDTSDKQDDVIQTQMNDESVFNGKKMSDETNFSIGSLNITVRNVTIEDDTPLFDKQAIIPKKDVKVKEMKQVPAQKFEKKMTTKSNPREFNTLVQFSTQTQQMESWPENTNINCWWCCHSFDTKPCTMPIEYDERRERFIVHGIFCSWNCVKAFNNYKVNNKGIKINTLITLFVKKLYGYIIPINSAPPRSCLKMFGGTMSIEDFRKSSLTSLHVEEPIRVNLYQDVITIKY